MKDEGKAPGRCAFAFCLLPSAFCLLPSSLILPAVDPRLVTLLVIGAIVVIAVALPLAWYNKLVRLRQLIRESWGNVDVQLKRRYDLIPNLVNTVKGYAAHERETLEAVVEARNRAAASNGPIGEQSRDEEQLVLATRRLMGVAEAYPQLKASQNFLALQQEL